jgi:hypothetical protein
MDSIFRLDSNGRMVIEPCALSLVPEFKKLSEPQVRYLVLAYDSANTIFKQQKYTDWPKYACQYIYAHTDFAMIEKPISHQIEMFKKLVYDEDRIQKAKLLMRKRQLQDEILDSKGAAPMRSINESIKIIEGMILELDAKISSADDEVILANKNGKLSLVEKWQRRIKVLQS